MKEQLLGKKQELASVVQQISIEHNKISADWTVLIINKPIHWLCIVSYVCKKIWKV